MQGTEIEAESARPPGPTPGTVELEIRLLDKAYAHLRVRGAGALARLVASLATEGQQHPVLVVRRESGRHVLIDGYGRVEALVRLGRDTVTALGLGLGEVEALAHCHRMQSAGRRSALEEGWLVAELLEQGQRPAEVRASLGQSPSWLSRRLGLAQALPEQATKAVRCGSIPAHGAMKSLVPLARANKAHCERLCERLGATRVSTRQLGLLYATWRAGDALCRERVVEEPLLLLKAKEASERKLPAGMAGVLVRALESARTALLRAADDVVRAGMMDMAVLSAAPVERALGRCTEAYEALLRHVQEPDAR
jgi:ParB-like chromosome segregation protein Spo0J